MCRGDFAVGTAAGADAAGRFFEDFDTEILRLVARRHARRTTEAPPRRWSRQGRISGHPWRPKLTNNTAPMAAERQSFLDDLQRD
jgi:hypothetical protein